MRRKKVKWRDRSRGAVLQVIHKAGLLRTHPSSCHETGYVLQTRVGTLHELSAISLRGKKLPT